MEFKVEASIGDCRSFVAEEGGKPQVLGVVIAPLKVTVADDGVKANFSMGCNFYQSCHNPSCYYSKVARDGSKKKT